MTDDSINTWMQSYPEPMAHKGKPRTDLQAATGILTGVLLGAAGWLLILWAALG